MKLGKKKLIVISVVIVVVSLILSIYFFNFFKNKKVETLDFRNNKEVEDIKNLEKQNSIEVELQELKKNNYTFDNPLILLNPYGTIMNGVYIFFKTEEKLALEYTISVDNYSNFTNMLVGDYTTYHEGMIVGFIQDTVNHLHLKLIDNNKVVAEKEYDVIMPLIDKTATSHFKIVESGEIEKITSGLFMPSGFEHEIDDPFVGMKLYDNSGILRVLLFNGSGGKTHTIQFTDNGDMIFKGNSNELIRLNRFGKVLDVYSKPNYTHTFYYKDEKLYYSHANKDGVYEYYLATHEEKELFNFRKLLPNTYKKEMEYLDSITDKTVFTYANTDWLHCNSLYFVNNNDIVVSSRERSTIFYVEDIFDNPTIKYVISDENFWDDTELENLVLNKDGDFIPQFGQHSIRVENIDEKHYYIYMFNNNSLLSTAVSNTSFYDNYPNVYQNGNKKENFKSKFYKYYVDDENGSYKLEQSFDVDFSSKLSNVQKLDNNYIVCSGDSKTITEYTYDGKLIAKYSVDYYENQITFVRTEKYDMKNIWFGTIKDYPNYYENNDLDIPKNKFNNYERYKKEKDSIFTITKDGSIIGFNYNNKEISVANILYFNDMYFTMYQYTKNQLVIPSKFNDLEIKKFFGINLTNVEEVIIEEGIEVIGNYAFLGCENLKKITLPSTLKKIDKYAFYKCNNLSEIEINSEVQIDDTAFAGWKSNQKIVIK